MTRPLVGAAVVIWGVAGILLVAGAVMTVKAPRDLDGQKKLGWSIALITAAVCFGGLGAVAFVATTGELAGRQFPQEAWVPATTTLSPIPIAPEAPTTSPTVRPSPRILGDAPIEIGFESIGEVEIGGRAQAAIDAFGEPSAKVSGVPAPDGKAATGFSYEIGSRDFVVFVRDERVVAYEIRSPGFVTFSGVRVGSSTEELEKAYPSRLERTDDSFLLDGPRGTGVRFEIKSGKVSNIKGGFL